MSSRTPEKQHVPSRRPPPVERHERLAGGTARGLWIGVIVALVAGVIGGYFLRSGTETTKTVTKTVTDTVTVAPRPYTSSTGVQAALSFDGTGCLYSGPAELKAGSTVDVTYTSTVDRGWFIWWLDPGTTYEQLMRSHTSTYNDPPAFVRGYSYDAGSGGFGGSNANVKISDGDLISIGCATHPGVVHATMLRVLPG